MKDTKIDWCDSTWNPVTGCLHGCEYCYARGIANRYNGGCGEGGIYELDEPIRFFSTDDKTGKTIVGKAEPYPYGFEPTLYRYRLDQPKKWHEPRTIFVCSMGDLFGEWVEYSWIKEVFRACENAPQHRYLFLTKNPARYFHLNKLGLLPNKPNFHYGVTIDTLKRAAEWSKLVYIHDPLFKTFASVEPILERFDYGTCVNLCTDTNWVIVGAESGYRIGRVVPAKGWIDDLARAAEVRKKPIFMKESLRTIMGDDFKQQFPWRAAR